jgi:hypothetical protein
MSTIIKLVAVADVHMKPGEEIDIDLLEPIKFGDRGEVRPGVSDVGRSKRANKAIGIAAVLGEAAERAMRNK